MDKTTKTFPARFSFVLHVLLTAGFFFLMCDAEAQQNSGSTYRSEYIFPVQEKHVHSSSVVELPNGDLLACWFEGSGERKANDVKVMGARQKKGQTQWGEPFVMADTPGNPDCNPVLFLDAKKRLHLTWVVVVANRWEASLLKTRLSTDYLNDGPPKWDWQDVILLKPGEEFAEALETGFREMDPPGLAWAEYAPQYERMIVEAAKNPVKREVGWMGRIQPLVLENGRILMPLYSDGYNVSLVAISDDHGDTWKPSLPIVGRGNIQPALLQKKDGTIVAWMRDNGDAPQRVIFSSSKDNGYTWSVSKKTAIPNPGASVEVIALDDGNWLMVNNDLEDGRNRLAVSLSDDEGTTWKWKRYVEYVPKDKGGFSYPTAIQTSDGRVHITYSFHTPGRKSIKHVSFLPSWVKEADTGDTNAEKLGFPKGKKVLLLHMDDLGMCREANDAGKYYIENDYILSGAVMMPCENAEEFVEWAKTQPKADVGVHLTLTSEWKSWRWPPLTDPEKVPGLLDSQGKMWRSVPEVVMNATPQEVEMEIRAQIEKMLAWGYQPTHIDTHMGTLYGSPEFLKVFLKVAEEYKIPANAIDLSNPKVAAFYSAEGYPVTDEVIEILGNYNLPHLDNFGSVPKGDTYEKVKSNFFALVNALDPGITEIIFHPSVETENMKTITGSWQQRAWEAEMFADPEVKKFFKDNDIILTTWREVMERFEKK
ncbi:ChbG/HpnK family deacetylase [Mariniphaga sediminis]|uniref:ChbG/HpnK family deacetylase n=1 Tax=Mariniphaga sediminis TaxID=1628158 RepID=UPI003561F7D0